MPILILLNIVFMQFFKKIIDSIFYCIVKPENTRYMPTLMAGKCILNKLRN